MTQTKRLKPGDGQLCRKAAELIWAGTDHSNTPARRLFDKQGATLSGDGYCEYEWLLED